MRVLALLAFVPGLAFAAPVDGYFQNDKGTVLHLQAASASGFDFTLTAGAPDGAAACPEGSTDCLQIEGHAAAGGKGFTFIDPQDDHSRVFFAEADTGIRVLSTTGDFGTGSANRGQMLALTGVFAKVDAKSDAVQADGAMKSGNPTDKATGKTADNSTDNPADTTTGKTADTTADATAKAPDPGTDELHAFRSPTGNISCLFDVGASTNVRCDMAQLNRSFTTPPKDCELDWGDSFGVAAGDKRGGLVCHGDTVADPAAEVLDYGSTLTFGGIACVSAKTGMTCQNESGHGFALARKSQTVF